MLEFTQIVFDNIWFMIKHNVAKHIIDIWFYYAIRLLPIAYLAFYLYMIVSVSSPWIKRYRRKYE